MIIATSPAFADSAPNISESQAIKIAQNFLNSQGLPFTAKSASRLDKVRVVNTGEVKWIDPGLAKADGKFQFITSGWAVQIVNQNGKNVGTVFVNTETGKIIETNISGTSVSMKTTGIPLAGLAMAILMIFGSLIASKR